MSAGQLGKRENWRQTSRPSVTTHTVMPNERCSWTNATACSLEDANSIEKAKTKIVATRNRVSQCRNRITGSKTSSSRSPSGRSIGIAHSHVSTGPAGGEIESGARLFLRRLTSVPNSGERVPWLREGRIDTNLLPRQGRRRG